MTSAILRSRELRDIEQHLGDTTPPLMERAGAAAARLAVQLMRSGDQRPLIFCGPGNNGGDGFVVARLLEEHGLDPQVVFVGDPARLPADAAAAYAAWQQAGGSELGAPPLGPQSLIVDAMFGIGLTRPLAAPYDAWVDYINSQGCPVLALDCPSGLDTETGRTLGATVQASHTISFIALKPGLLTLDGPDHCGMIAVADLELAGEVNASRHGWLISRADFALHLQPRRLNSHKGSHGAAGIIGGAPGMSGAALLAARAALRLGAGRVYGGLLEALAVDPLQPELMLRKPEDLPGLVTALAIGPGLGDSRRAAELLRSVIELPLPLVIDADALNLLAQHPAWLGQLERREAPTLMTPHPLEAARLLGCDLDAVQADRVGSAQALAERCGADVVLKGCGSVLASADGRWGINASGNPGLAAAGSGDVLTGMAVALLAQGWTSWAALAGAVHLHGAAADELIARQAGPVGLTASELADVARGLLNRWIVGGDER
jgi:hydroxyethylthiazole kinase-like uncharacterized protein yjeF